MADPISTLEWIRTIGSLWPLVATTGVVTLGLVYRPQLRTLLGSVSEWRLKRGDNELSAKHRPQLPGPVGEDEDEPGQTQEEPSEPIEEGPEGAEAKMLADQAAPDGEKRDAKYEMFMAYMDGDEETGAAVYEQAIVAADSKEERLELEVLHCFLRARLGHEEALGRLKELAETPSCRFEAVTWLAIFWQESGDLERALTHIGCALSEAGSGAQRRQAMLMKSQIFESFGKADEALDYLLEEANAVTELPGAEGCKVFRRIAELAKELGQDDVRAMALLQASQLDPTASGLPFDIAYSLSELDVETVAAAEYDRLIRRTPQSAAALNNYGVSLTTLGVKGAAVDAQVRAARSGNTLAAANLAYSLMDAGFFEKGYPFKCGRHKM